MALYLEVVEGFLKGSTHKIQAGFKLGRTACEILIPDSKISNTHAQIEQDQKGRYILLDLDSSNGLLVNGVKVKRIALLPGVKFQAGKTHFKVIDVVEENVVIVPKKSISEEPEKAHWLDLLTKTLPRLGLGNKNPAEPVQVFHPMIRLQFLTGLQADQTYVLGYGPRSFGSESLDLELLDTAAPAEAFQLTPDPAGVRFSTSAPESVQLNNKPISSDLVKAGDRIYLGQTIIQINFEE